MWTKNFLRRTFFLFKQILYKKTNSEKELNPKSKSILHLIIHVQQKLTLQEHKIILQLTKVNTKH